jgi:hypothetical protein
VLVQAGFRAGFREKVLELRDWLPATPSRLIPFQIVAAFRMMLFVAGDPNVITNDPAVTFDDRSKGPPAGDLHHLDDIDAPRTVLLSPLSNTSRTAVDK